MAVAADSKSRDRFDRLPLITLTTDFGTHDPYVGAMKGAMLCVCPDLHLIDLSHDIAAQDVPGGSYLLQHATETFPAGTIHVAVIDPGVGGDRRALAIDDGRHRWIGPDNGLFSHVLRRPDVRVFQITRTDLQRDVVSPTFHGRDLFGPVAASLATGIDVSEVGPAVGDAKLLEDQAAVRSSLGLAGSIQHVDHFGNLITSISKQDLAGFPSLEILAGHLRIEELSSTYTDVAAGAPLALIGSGGMLEISIRGGSAAVQLGIGRGEQIHVTSASENSA